MLRRPIGTALAFFFLALPAMAEPLTLTGSVTYQERVTLPDGAKLRVNLVTLEGGTLIAGASDAVNGRPPHDFTLNVRSAVPAGTQLGLVAGIEVGGRTILRNDRPVPVVPGIGGSVTIPLHRSTVSTAPPPDAEPLPDLALPGTSWRVTSVSGTPARERGISFSISPDLRIGGTGGCNSYFAEASIESGKITFGPIAATRMACAPELMTEEANYFTALAGVAGYELTGSSLHLLDAAGVPLVGLVRETE